MGRKGKQLRVKTSTGQLPRMTHRRRRVLLTLLDARQEGENITLAEIARRAGLTCYRDARRVVRDLERYGII